MLVRIKNQKSGKMQVVGTVDGSTFSKEVIHSRHFFNKTSSYGIQQSVFDKLPSLGVKKVCIVEKDTGKVFTSRIADWDKYGVYANYGFGDQVMLSIYDMDEDFDAERAAA